MALQSFGQRVLIHVNEGDSAVFYEDIINAHTKDQLFGQSKSYAFSDIIAVIFAEEPITNIQEVLENANVTVVEKYGDESIFKTQQSLNLVIKEEVKDPLYVADKPINTPAGNASHNIEHKVVKAVGMLCLTGSVMLLAAKTPENFTLDDLEKRRQNVQLLAGIGGFTLTISFFYD